MAYEPVIGKEESALKTPVAYENSSFIGGTHNLFVEQPMLENYYPGASVGYRKVRVASVAPSEAAKAGNTIDNTVAPVSEHEFYTPKDFPVLVDETDLSNDPAITRPVAFPYEFSAFRKKRERSQGYSIVLNDMAGKPKATAPYTRGNASYTKGENLLSKQEYIYHTEVPFSEKIANRLKNDLPVLTENGKFQTGRIGVSHEVFMEIHEDRSSSSAFGIDGNLEILNAPPAFGLAIVPIPYVADQELSSKTAITMKVIHKSGILKELRTTADKSLVVQNHIAYDALTGSPLLTSVTNEWEEPVYSANYTAHRYFYGKGDANQNNALQKENLQNQTKNH